MTIRKPPGKRLTSLLLSLALLLTLVPAMGTTASAANRTPGATTVTVDNNKLFGLPSKLYYKNGDSADNFTGTAGDYNAHYDPNTGVLTLKDYEGGRIAVGGPTPADLIIELTGNNNTVTGTIENTNGGDLTITGNSSLTVSNEENANGCGIAAGLSSVFKTGSVTITDNAKVTIRVTTEKDKNIYGIHAKENITVSGNASVDIVCRTPNRTSANANFCGMFVPNATSGGRVTIDTTGNIDIDVSEAGCNDPWSYGVSAPNYTLTTVGSMEVQWADGVTSKGVPFFGGASFSTPHAVNVDTSNRYASYRSGTPYKVTVTGGYLTGPGVKYERNSGYFLAGDTVNLTAPTRYADSDNTVEIPFDKWVSNDVTITNESDPTVSFEMPSKDVAVRANYNPFTVQPTFTRTSGTEGTISFTLVSGKFDDMGRPKIYPVGSSTSLGYFYTGSATQKTFTVYENDCPYGQYVVGVSYNGVMCYSEPFRVKYTKPSASVAEEVTVEGEANQKLGHDYTVTVTLEHDTFASPLSGEWIENLPNGLSQSVTRIGDQTATITISGTPKVGCTADMEIIIPAGALMDESGTPVKVSIGGKAKFNITSNAPTADKIQIGDGSSNKFSADKLYYKNGTDGASGGFTGSDLDYNAKYDPQTGTLTLNGYNGPHIKIDGNSSQTVIVKLVGDNNKVNSEWYHAIELVGGVNLIITADADANLNLTARKNQCGIGSANAGAVGFVTISGSAKVTINASTDDSLLPACGIRSGKDVEVRDDASLKIICSSDNNAKKGYGIYASNGKVTVNTSRTVEIVVSGCANSDTHCIFANNIAFKNAEKIMLTYASVCSPTYPGASVTDRFDASGMKLPTTTTDSTTDATIVTYAKKGAPPAKPTISADNCTNLTASTEVKLSGAQGVKIYYTIDGKTPTTESTPYTVPFQVTATCTVKAVAYSAEDRLYSEVATQLFKWKEYSISFASTDGNGKAYDERNKEITKAEAGAEIYLKADQTKSVIGGKERVFSGWTVEKGTVTIVNSNSFEEAYFIMPAGDVTVKANYIEKPAGVTVRGTVTSYGSATEVVVVTLTKSGESTPAQTVTLSAPGSGSTLFTQNYSFSAVPDGTYTLKVEKKGHAPWTEEITVSSSAVTKNVTIYLIGDVDGNGKVEQKDSMILSRYFAGWSGYETKIVSSAAADVDQDGELKLKDSMILGRYFAGWSEYAKYFQ